MFDNIKEIQDGKIKEAVISALSGAPISNLEVLVANAEVTVRGGVSSASDKAVVLDRVQGVEGVSKIIAGINVEEETKAHSGETYTVKPGDSMWAIAQQYLGNGNDWMKIYEENKALIGAQPDLIHPGYVLKIPAKA